MPVHEVSRKKSGGPSDPWVELEKSFSLNALIKLRAGELKDYWDYVLDAVDYVYQKSSDSMRSIGGTTVSNVIDAARGKEKGSEEYKRAVAAIDKLTSEFFTQQPVPVGKRVKIVNQMIRAEILGLSIVDPIWNARKKVVDPNTGETRFEYIVEEVWINGPDSIQFISNGKRFMVPAAQFKDANHALRFCNTIIAQANRSDLQISQMSPYVDARLADLSRVAIEHPSINPGGPSVAIRRHTKEYVTLTDMTDRWGTLNHEMIQDLAKWIYGRMSILVIGETSSGKTTLLNALSGLFPESSRIITIEDVLELELNPNKPYKVPGWEARRPKKTDKGDQGGFSIRDHVKASLRFSPDIVVIGEVRDAAAFDLTDAANTGHQVFSTLHANGPEDAIVRLTNLISMGGEVSGAAALPMIASAFDLIIYAERLEDGSRKVTNISEVGNTVYKDPETHEDTVKTTTIWEYTATGKDANGKIQGDWHKVHDISPLTSKRHRLDLIPNMDWDTILDNEGFDGKHKHRSKLIKRQ